MFVDFGTVYSDRHYYMIARRERKQVSIWRRSAGAVDSGTETKMLLYTNVHDNALCDKLKVTEMEGKSTTYLCFKNKVHANFNFCLPKHHDCRKHWTNVRLCLTGAQINCSNNMPASSWLVKYVNVM